MMIHVPGVRSAVVTTCGNCGRESPGGFQFCPHCGHRLADSPAPQTERRIVTVLFCDLVGFTARSDRADPEDVRAILRPFHALARAEIERHGGTLDKFIGDAAMGVFGSPVAHEDDPERAVRAALGIAAGIPGLAEERWGEPFDVRIGLNTGEAVVTLSAGVQEGEAVAGDVVNTASRLQSAAPVGGVLVGESTYLATRDVVEYRQLEPVSAKGKAEPLRVWRALAVRPLAALSERAAASPFVGRRDEQTLLEQTLLEVVSGPGARLVTIVGEPGVGKSRLVAEFAAALPRLVPGAFVQWRRGRCLPYGEGITFWALGEIVKDQARILDSDPLDDRDRKLESALDQLVADPAERAWMRVRLSPLVGGEGGPAVDRAEAFTAWQRFLEAVARAGPLVTIFEDLHWADPAMVAFLEHLAEHSSGVPLLVIVTARPEVHDRFPAWAGRGNGVEVSLPPLSEQETEALVSNLLFASSLPPEVRTLLLERSGGNPLYAEEFARALRERGLVDRSGRLTKDPGELGLPETLQALIAARLDTLTRDHKAVLQDASVIGREFWSGAVAFLGEAGEGVVRDALEELVRRELVRPAETSSLREQAEYTFWHALVRDVAYAQIPRAGRAAKHRRAVAWIEATAGERAGDLAEILAHHATSAIDLATAAGETDGLEDLERTAARYLQLAAVRTMTLDVAKAEVQLLRAFELTPPGHPDRPRVQASLGEAAFNTGRLEEAQQLFEQAIAGLRGQGEVREAADAMVRRAVVLEYRGDSAAGRALLSEAIELLAELPPGPELARALATSAGGLMVSGRYEETIAQADRAIELAEDIGEPVAAARAHGFRGYVRAVQGDPGGVDEQRQALEGFLELGLGRGTAIVYNNLGSSLLHVEGPQAAMDVLQEGLGFAERRGLREMVMALQSAMNTVLFELGEWDDVLLLCQEVIEEARRQGSGYDEVFAESDRAAVLAYRTGAAALDLCEPLVEQARALDETPILVKALVAGATARRASGDEPGTVDFVREVLDATGGAAVVVRAAELPQLVRLAVAANDLGLAERLLDGVDEFRLERYRLAAMTARVVLAEARAEWEPALQGYEEAVELWARWGNALERAHALFGAGRCLVRLDRSQEAGERFEAAHQAFARLEAEPAIAEVRAAMKTGPTPANRS
jgi:class 3 adenylate cyclase/tetratricopeptide (TPR) repeat protein